MTAKTTVAATYHERGYGCAQAVLASFAEDFGLAEEAALRWLGPGRQVSMAGSDWRRGALGC